MVTVCKYSYQSVCDYRFIRHKIFWCKKIAVQDDVTEIELPMVNIASRL